MNGNDNKNPGSDNLSAQELLSRLKARLLSDNPNASVKPEAGKPSEDVSGDKLSDTEEKAQEKAFSTASNASTVSNASTASNASNASDTAEEIPAAEVVVPEAPEEPEAQEEPQETAEVTATPATDTAAETAATAESEPAAKDVSDLLDKYMKKAHEAEKHSQTEAKATETAEEIPNEAGYTADNTVESKENTSEEPQTEEIITENPGIRPARNVYRFRRDIKNSVPEAQETENADYSAQENAPAENEEAPESVAEYKLSENGAVAAGGAEKQGDGYCATDYTAEIEKQNAAGSTDKPNIDMMIALGLKPEAVRKLYGDEAVEEYKKEIGKVPVYAPSEHKNPYEYTDESQAKEMMEEYRSANNGARIRLIIAAVLSFVLLLYENLSIFGVEFIGFLSMTDYPVIHIMIGLQLFLLTAALAFRSVTDGIKDIIKLSPTSDSVCAVITVFTVIFDIAACFVSGMEIWLYNFPAALCIVFTILFEYLNIRRETSAFNIVASRKTKYIARNIPADEASGEADAFGEFVDDDYMRVIRVGRTSFVDNFVSRSDEKRPSQVNKVLLPLAVIVIIGLFAVSMILHNSASLAFSVANIALMMCLPATVFCAEYYPLYDAARKSFNTGSAIIGESAIEEYADPAVVTFEDRDVYPSYSVKVKNIKVYGNGRIDRILYDTASLFSLTGGPLCDVFELATADIGHSDSAKLTGAEEDGIAADIEGSEVLIGKDSYMQKNGIFPLHDLEDESYLRSGDIGILYVAEDGVLTAKYYIQYMMDVDFISILKQLHRKKVFTVIRTFDPNITEELLSHSVDLNRYAVKIVRCGKDDRLSVSSERADSGVVSTESPKALMQTVIMCGNLYNVLRTNSILKAVSVVVSLCIMAFVSVISASSGIHSLYVALYQLFWMLPPLLISKLYI